MYNKKLMYSIIEAVKEELAYTTHTTNRIIAKRITSNPDRNLYKRIARITKEMAEEGILLREECLSANKTITYKITKIFI